MKTNKTRLRVLGILAVVLALSLIGTARQTWAADGPTEIRIGYQRGGIWSFLKQKKILEEKFGPNVKISWALFPAGPQLLEALNGGALDIGSTGETPPIFAQAAGTPLVYVASVSGNGAGQAILVPQDSPLKDVSELKGKKIAFNKASSAHLMLVKALRKFNLDYKDIQPVFLAPPEARAAFQGGSIDAWVIWDPFRSAAIKELNARPLVEGQNVAPTKSYIEASKDFVGKYPDAVRAIVQEVQKWTTWERNNIDEYAQVTSQETGISVEVLKFALQTEIPDYFWIDDDAIAYQQDTADIFFKLGLIPDKLNIHDVVWVGGTNPILGTPAATVAAAAGKAATASATASK